MDYLSFATKAATRQERSAQWRNITQAPHAELGDDQEASIRGCDLGDLRICAVSMGEHQIDSVGQHCGPDRHNLIKILFMEEGHCDIVQSGQTIRLDSGQWCAFDKAVSYSMIAPQATRLLALALPRHRFAAWDKGARQPILPQSFLQGAASILHSSTSAAVNAATAMGRRDRGQMGNALIQMLNTVWDADPVAQSANSTRARRLAVIDFVDRNLADRDLDVAQIAQEMGYAKRTLHKLFADDAETLGRMIWHRRLDRCRQDLLDPAQAHRSITDIAHYWGFNDSQHFSRSFKGRFGETPRAFRSSRLFH